MAQNLTLGEILIQKNMVSRERIEQALCVQAGGERRLGHILTKMGVITDEDLFSALSSQRGIPVINFEKKIDDKILKILPRHICLKYSALPVGIESNNILRVAMANPLDQSAINDIDHYTGMVVKPMLAREKEIRRAIRFQKPIQWSDIWFQFLYNRMVRLMLCFFMILLGLGGLIAYKEIHLAKYGTASTSGNISVYSNHDIMIGVEGKGAISLIGHGPYSKGFYSIVFDDVKDLKEFINQKKQNYSKKQYEWINWILQNKLQK